MFGLELQVRLYCAFLHWVNSSCFKLQFNHYIFRFSNKYQPSNHFAIVIFNSNSLSSSNRYTCEKTFLGVRIKHRPYIEISSSMCSRHVDNVNKNRWSEAGQGFHLFGSEKTSTCILSLSIQGYSIKCIHIFKIQYNTSIAMQ